MLSQHRVYILGHAGGVVVAGVGRPQLIQRSAEGNLPVSPIAVGVKGDLTFSIYSAGDHHRDSGLGQPFLEGRPRVS